MQLGARVKAIRLQVAESVHPLYSYIMASNQLPRLPAQSTDGARLPALSTGASPPE